MEYQYKAMKPTGEVMEGIFIADSRQEVIEMLKKKSNFPISVEENRPTGTKEINFRNGVSQKELAFFCRQLQAMLYAGSTITKSLDIMKRQLTNRTLKNAVAEIHDEVQKGNVLSEAMKNYPKIFPEMMVYLVESGELSGTLDVVLIRLAVYFEKNAKLRAKIISALVYPILLFIMSVIVVIFMSVFIMPTFVSMFESSGVPLPGLTKALLKMSVFIRTKWYLIIVIVIAIALGIYQYINTESGRRHLDSLKLRLPILKGVNQKIMTAKFTRNLSTMLASGVPLLNALKNLSQIIGNKHVEEAIMDYRSQIQQGVEFHQAVRDSGYFPAMVDGMIEIGKESGTLDDVLEKTADYYEDEVDQALQRLVSLFEPFMIIIIAFIVGFIVISMVLPMFDMFQTISR